MDLGKELHSIGHYINDKEEMIRQVFSVIKGKKLRAMLPPFLADLDVEDVKALCLEQLMGMSKQRIRLTLYIPRIYSNVGRLFCTPAPPKFTKKLAVDSFFNFGS